MNLLITGAKGFIGKNLVATLCNIKQKKDLSHELTDELTIFEYDLDTDEELLEVYCKKSDFIFHLAGVNRPQNQEEFMDGNFGFTSKLLQILKKHRNTCPIVVSSSVQAELDNAYGKSKKAGEDLLIDYQKETGAQILIYRFTNVFGKWCRPNYNSVVATFCNNIANDLPIHINDRNKVMQLIYIDDLIKELLQALIGKQTCIDGNLCGVAPVYKRTLGEIADLIYSFKRSRNSLCVPNMKADGFEKKLYATYLSYLPEKEFSYPLKMHIDDRGSFTELLKSSESGQVSVNISKPGVVKGNHWHHTKIEKFIVVNGEGLLQFRRIDSNQIIEYRVSGSKLEIVDIPPGYTHNIINIGKVDLITIMWANECFDAQNPDTFYMTVVEER